MILCNEACDSESLPKGAEQNKKGPTAMNPEQRAEFLKDEYVMLQQFYEDIDERGLTIKSWAITVALAAIGTGIVYRKEVLLVGFFTSLVFWYLEAHWRGLSHFFSTRIKNIESAFQTARVEDEVPLQVYSTWEKEYQKSKDQTLKYMFKTTAILPHSLIAVICLLLYFLF